MADNAITDISPLAKFVALTFLDLSIIEISRISALAPLIAFINLDLSGNKIDDDPIVVVAYCADEP